MSVAGIPAFLEERQVFVRERMNGLYGPGAYVLANSLCTLPYLFVCAVVFAVLWYVQASFTPHTHTHYCFALVAGSLMLLFFQKNSISYWSIGLHPGATPFFRFLGILFLAVYTAESQVRSRCPIRFFMRGNL